MTLPTLIKRTIWIASLVYSPFQLFSSSNVIQAFSPTAILQPMVLNLSDTVITVFISPECPICQKYTRRLNGINEEFSGENFNIVGVVSGNYYTQQDVVRYKLRYGVKYDVIIDTSYTTKEKWNASTTPEVILSIGDSIYYRGMIDNWFYAVGRSSNKTTNHFLINAIKSLKNNRPIKIVETKPIGCFIE